MTKKPKTRTEIGLEMTTPSCFAPDASTTPPPADALLLTLHIRVLPVAGAP
jgi:hypothetical protein